MKIAPLSAIPAVETRQPAPASASAQDPNGPAFAAALDGFRSVGEIGPRPPLPGRGSRSGELEPLVKFESFVLRTFVESMLPDQNTSFFGEGTAGAIWKSMLAERIGDEIAAGGGIGIADMLAAEKASGQATGAAQDKLAVEADRTSGLSRADGQ